MPTSSASSNNGDEQKQKCVETTINGFRALKLAQVRKQLEDDFTKDHVRFCKIIEFVTAALDQ